jgi:hypothetical protein
MSKNIPDLSLKLAEFNRSIDQLQKFEKVEKNGIIKDALQSASFLIPASSARLASRLDLATEYIQELNKDIEVQIHSETPLTPEEVVKRKRFNARKFKFRLISYRLLGVIFPSFLFIYFRYMNALEAFELVSSGREELDLNTQPEFSFESALFYALVVIGWSAGGYFGRHLDKNVGKFNINSKNENYKLLILLTLGCAVWGSVSEFMFHDLEQLFKNGYKGQAIEYIVGYVIFSLANFFAYLLLFFLPSMFIVGFIKNWKEDR